MCILRRLRELLIVFAVIVLCMISNKHCLAQEGNMVSYFATQCVMDIAEDGNILWLATAGGLVKFDKEARAPVAFYNTSNSDIPTNSISCIAIDKQKNIWIGTSEGLVKFNGTSWELFPNSETGLEYKFVGAVAIDTAGNVWAGNGYSGVMYDGVNWQQLTFSNIGISLSITDIVADKQGYVWFISQGSNVVRFDGEEWMVYTPEMMGVSNSTFARLDVDDNGVAWVMTYYYLLRFDGTTWSKVPVDHTAIMNTASIDCGPDNKVWCIYTDDLLSAYDGTGWTDYVLPEIPIQMFPYDIHVSENGVVWVGAINGLFKLENGIITSLPVSQVKFQSNWIKDIEIDVSGKLWITDKDLYSYDTAWTYYPYWGDDFTRLKFDMNGLLWLAGTFGIYTYNGIFERLLGAYEGNGIAVSPSNEKWFATGWGYGGTLVNYTDSTFTFYNYDNSIVNGPVNNVVTETDGTVWFTDAGVKKFNGQDWTHYSVYNSEIPFDYASCITLNNLGTVYVGSYNHGLAKFDGYNWTLLDKSNSPLTDNQINCLKFDQQGNLWIGTQEGGLFCTDGEQWWNLNMDNSTLPDNLINDIEFKGNIKWIATSSGLVSYDGMGVLLSKGEPVEMNQIKVYPNPANESIHFNIPEGKYQVSIINLQGTIVQTIITTSNMLDIASLSPSMYCLRILSEDECYSTKFIKQ